MATASLRVSHCEIDEFAHRIGRHPDRRPRRRPRERRRQCWRRLQAVRVAEAALEAKVKGGLEIPDFVRTVLAPDRVGRVG
jgi:hypothetical protein